MRGSKISHWLKSIAYIAIPCFMMTSEVLAQTTVAELEVNGESVNSANITFAVPKKKPAPAIVKVNQEFVSGTLFIIPAKTVVWLTSNGNKQRLGPGSKHLASAGPQGESHQTFWGKVQHFVTNRLNFYKASGPSTKHQGAVRGTVFTVEAIGKDVKFGTQEGTVAIEREINVNIAEQPKKNVRKERKLSTIKTTFLKAGDPEEIFDHNFEDGIHYDSYDEAISFFQQELEQADSNGIEAELIVENYTVLGELFLDVGNPPSAIGSFERAIDLYESELDYDNRLIAENYIGLGEAHYDVGRYEEGTVHCNTALQLIFEDLEYLQDDFDYFKNNGDDATAWSIGSDLVDAYEQLGWCYDILSNFTESDKYYALADDLEAQLEQF